MPDDRITVESQRFLTTYVHSVAQLELLLLMRTNPERAWTVDDLVNHLRVERAWAQQQLTRLADHGLLLSVSPAAEAEEPAFRYAPRTPELERAVTSVAQDYLLHRVAVIEFIYSRPPDTDTMRAFADAFRLRKEPPHG